MEVRLAVAALVKTVCINIQANMAKGACRINMGIPFTNRKLPSIQYESVPRSMSKASTIINSEKSNFVRCLAAHVLRIFDLSYMYMAYHPPHLYQEKVGLILKLLAYQYDEMTLKDIGIYGMDR